MRAHLIATGGVILGACVLVVAACSDERPDGPRPSPGSVPSNAQEESILGRCDIAPGTYIVRMKRTGGAERCRDLPESTVEVGGESDAGAEDGGAVCTHDYDPLTRVVRSECLNSLDGISTTLKSTFDTKALRGTIHLTIRNGEDQAVLDECAYDVEWVKG
jgi:hypothetical protein